MNTHWNNDDMPPVYTPVVWEPADAEEAVALKREHGADAVWVAGRHPATPTVGGWNCPIACTYDSSWIRLKAFVRLQRKRIMFK